ncbi:MAG: twin-arginine translocase TatA/TatE family subunit [Proteobacteria bacterium]|jgi:sec-independent protein translocase protein TatA|nr:MAG: twin-arginine translocase TatA/TatE family subunit [Pseudomonadota bacterium]
MGATSIWHWIIVLLIVVLLFGRGKISEIMGDVAKGIKSFKKGMAEDEAPAPSESPKVIEQSPVKPVERAEAESSKAS